MDITQKDCLEIIKSVGEKFSDLKGNTILITGANGVVGSYLVRVLHLLNKTKFRGNEIRCICLTKHAVAPTSRLGYLSENKFIRFIISDVCKPVSITQKIQYIIHNASYASPKTYTAKPIETMMANSVGTQMMLNLAKKHKAKMIFISSGAIYGDAGKDKKMFTEKSFGNVFTMDDRAIYAESKRFGETLCYIYSKYFSVDITVARLSNMFGPSFTLDDGRAIPDFFNQAFSRNVIEINGNPLAKRAYLYISDAITGIFSVLLAGKSGEAYNISSEKTYSIKDIAEMIARLFPNCRVLVKKDILKMYVLDSPKVNIASAKKISKNLGWKQKISINEGLKRLYRAYSAERK